MTITQRIDHDIRSLAQGLDLTPEKITGVGDVNHWCVDDQTEVLTINGWCHHDEIGPGTIVRTLNHETGLAEWQPVESVYLAAVADEPMIAMVGRNHSSVTTPNHRWPIERADTGARRFVHTEDLGANDRITTGAPSADLPTEAKYTDDVVELVAWYWTEGHRRPEGSASIAQSHTVNPDRVARIRGALTRSFGPAVRTLRGSARPAWRESIQVNDSSHGGPVTIFHLNRAATAVLDDLAPAKHVTLDFVHTLTLSQLDLFIDVSAQGDGQHYRSGRLDIWQRDPDALDAYEVALILSGRMTLRCETDGGDRVGVWGHQTRIGPVKAASADGTMTIESVAYTGTLWCPVTPNGTWLARRDGTVYYTGNTAWQVAEETISAHVGPLAQSFCEDLTVSFLLPTYKELMKAKGTDPANWEMWKYAVVFDLSEIVSSPNASEHAKWAWENLIMSDDDALGVLGFDPKVKPSPEEIEERLRIINAKNASSTAGQISEHPVTEAAEPAPDPVPPKADKPDGEGDQQDGEGDDEQKQGPPASGPPKGPPQKDDKGAGDAEKQAGQREVLAAMVLGAAVMSAERALERAGARLATRVSRSKDADERARAEGQPAVKLSVILGPGGVERIGLDDDYLLQDAWMPFAERMVMWGVSPELATRIVTATDNVTRRRLYDADIDVEALVKPLIDLAVG